MKIDVDNIDLDAVRAAVAARESIDFWQMRDTCKNCPCPKCEAARIISEAGYISFFAGSYWPRGTTLEIVG